MGRGAALGSLGSLAQNALDHERALPDSNKPLYEFRTHARYNPEAATALNVVPGLVGVILTMTMPIFPRCL